MKKKIFAMLFVLVLIATSITALVACDNAGGGKNISALQTEKKYHAESTVNSGLTEADILAQPGEYLQYQSYYVFHANGTGEYICNKVTDDYYNNTLVKIHAKYTLRFKYTYVDDDKSAVVCFYDGLNNQSIIIENGYKDETDNIGKPYDYDFTDWSKLVTVSKNVLCVTGTGYTFYINEEFVKQIPNFNKSAEE